MVLKYKPIPIVYREPTKQYSPIYYLVLLLPVVCHLLVVYKFSSNIPYIDDYTFIVDCLHWQAIQLTPLNVINHLVEPHGDHIILFARLITFLDYLIEGELNLRTLIFIGNLTLLGTIGLLFSLIKRNSLHPLYLLPIPLILLQPQYYENTVTWAICALQHLPSLFFAFLAFDLISRKTKVAFTLGLFSAFLALFSNGNGPAVLIAGSFLCIVQTDVKRLLVWISFAIISGSMYYSILHTGNPSSINYSLYHLLRVIYGFFLVTGSIGTLFTDSQFIISVIGVLITACSVTIVYAILTYSNKSFRSLSKFNQSISNNATHWLLPSKDRQQYILLSCYLYIFITIFAISFARSTGWYLALLLPRFIWFATAALVLLYVFLLICLKHKYLKKIVYPNVIISLLFNLISYINTYQEFLYIEDSLVCDSQNWKENKILSTLPPYSTQYDRYYSEVLDEAIKKKVYKLPLSHIEGTLQQAKQATITSALFAKDSTFSLGQRSIRYLAISDNLPLLPHYIKEKKMYLVLQSNQHTFAWPVQRSNSKLMLNLVIGDSQWSQRTIWLFNGLLPSGQYKVSLLWQSNTEWNKILSKQPLIL